MENKTQCKSCFDWKECHDFGCQKPNIMENKTDKPYSHKQAKNDIAKKYGYESWFDINFYQVDSNNVNTKAPYSEEVLRDEAAELYTSKATEELRYYIRLQTLNASKLIEDNAVLEQKVEELRKDFDEAVESNENLRKEMECLIEIHHLQSEEFLSELTQVTGEKEELRKENEELQTQVSMFQTDRSERVEEMKRLKESNKELVEKTIDYMVAFNLSTSYTSIEEAKQEVPKLFEAKKKAAREWLDQLKSEGDVNKKI